MYSEEESSTVSFDSYYDPRLVDTLVADSPRVFHGTVDRRGRGYMLKGMIWGGRSPTT